jgi:hypothetical protein
MFRTPVAYPGSTSVRVGWHRHFPRAFPARILPGAATHVLNVPMIGKKLANTTAFLEDKNIVFCLKLEENNGLNKKTCINQ